MRTSEGHSQHRSLEILTPLSPFLEKKYSKNYDSHPRKEWKLIIIKKNVAFKKIEVDKQNQESLYVKIIVNMVIKQQMSKVMSKKYIIKK